MKKLFCVIISIVLLAGSANVRINDYNGKSVDYMSVLTAENTTDRVIGKYFQKII